MNVGSTGSSRADRFYTWFGLAFALVAFSGFARTYYLKVVFGTPSLPLLLHVHGIVMTLWVVLFLVQVRLIASHRTDLHRALGVVGAFLAALVIILATVASIGMARRDVIAYPNSQYPLSFLALQLVGLVLVFAILISAALYLRRRPDYHKRLMVLALLRLLPPATTRLPIAFIHRGGVPVLIGIDVLSVLIVVIMDSIKHRRLHPAFGWGGLLLAASDFLVVLLSGTSAWLRFARWLIA
jgi:hypothetical protein